MVIVCLILYVFLILPAFSNENEIELNNRKRSKILNKLICEKANTLSNQFNMQQIGTTVGMPGGIIELLGASFQKESATIEEARKIVVYSCLEFLEAINSNLQLRPYLYQLPFTLENIELRIFFEDENYDAEENFLSSISCFGGNIFYRYKKKGERYGYSKEIKESVEEARKKLENKNATSEKK
jgi:hypothetical protein